MQITLNANELDLAIKDYVRDRIIWPKGYTIGRVEFWDSTTSIPVIQVKVELEVTE